MKEEAYATVYAAGLQAFLSQWHTIPADARSGLSRKKPGMERARESARKCVMDFKELMDSLPDADLPDAPAVPSDMDDNPDAGTF